MSRWLARLGARVTDMTTSPSTKALTACALSAAGLLAVTNLSHAQAAESSLPSPTSMLGSLDMSIGQHAVVFDTNTGIYYVDNLPKNDTAHRRSIEFSEPGTADGDSQPPTITRWVFDFDSLLLGPLTSVSVTGAQPLFLMTKGAATLERSAQQLRTQVRLSVCGRTAGNRSASRSRMDPQD
jgi:hypothetical protein